MDRAIAVAVVDSFMDDLVKRSEVEAENLAVVRRPVGGVRLPPLTDCGRDETEEV